MERTILQFTGLYKWLSNFYPSQIALDGFTWPTVEHYYQAMKSESPEVQAEIRALPTAGQAKRYGKKVKVRDDWYNVSFTIMEKALRAKFDQNAFLKEKLLQLAGWGIQEGNTWGDTFWGIDLTTGEGLNNLGKMLMNLRDDYLKEARTL